MIYACIRRFIVSSYSFVFPDCPYPAAGSEHAKNSKPEIASNFQKLCKI
jgi:hypothetical protein